MAYLERVGSSQLDANSVDNSKLAQMSTLTIKGNDTGGTADPQDLTVTEVSTMLINDSGTGTTDLWSADKIQSQINASVTGGVVYKGGYNASTNSPDLDTSPSGVLTGDMYTVTAAGNFFTEAVEVGDVLIAEVDSADELTEWTIVQKNEDGVVSGPVSSVNDNVAFFDGTTGKLIKDSGLTLSGSNTGDEVSATDAVEGIVELATQAEVNTGTDTGRVVTPATLAGSTLAGNVTGSVTVHSDVTDAGSGAIITTAERNKVGFITVTQAVDLDTIESDTATNNAKVSADGLVTTHSDVTDAGSGAIITTDERSKLSRAVVTKVAGDSPYTASNYEIVNYETAAGASTVNLPAGSAGAVVSVKMGAGTNTLTVDGNSTETIDGALTFTTTQAYSAFNFVWNDTEWMVM